MQTIRRRKAHTAETTGVFTVLVGSARDHHRIQSAFDLVLRDHNLHVALDSANQLSTLGERRRAEFGDLVDDPVFAPLFHESHRSYLKHRRMANGPLRRKSSTRLKTVRAVGYLREILEASLARENGLPGAVIDGRWKRNPNGTFVCQAVMQGDPQPLDLWSWQKGLARPTHSVDVGMSFTEEGLAVSAQPIRNTLIRRGPTKTLLGKPVPARVDSTEDFRVDDPARKPKRYLIPHDVVVRPGFVETLLGTLKGKHSIRTVGIDGSVVPRLTPELRRAFSQLVRETRKRAAEDAIAICRVVSTVGLENQRDCDYGELRGWDRRHSMEAVPLECPHCGQQLIAKADPVTGTPKHTHERCVCGINVNLGQVLADRARARAVRTWEGFLTPTMCQGLDLPEKANPKTKGATATANKKVDTPQHHRISVGFCGATWTHLLAHQGQKVTTASSSTRGQGPSSCFDPRNESSWQGSHAGVGSPNLLSNAPGPQDTPQGAIESICDPHGVPERAPSDGSLKLPPSSGLRRSSLETHTKTGTLRMRPRKPESMPIL